MCVLFLYLRALKAPRFEKRLRGRILNISPADSWHQPTEDANGRVNWKPKRKRQNNTVQESNST